MDDFGQNNGSAQDNQRKKTDIQREIIMSEADLRKVANEKIAIEAETRKLKKESDNIRISLQEKQLRLRKVEQDISMQEMEIAHLKKQLNLL